MKHIWSNVGPVSLSTNTISRKTMSKHFALNGSDKSYGSDKTMTLRFINPQVEKYPAKTNWQNSTHLMWYKCPYNTNGDLAYLLTYLLHGAESFLRSQLVLQLIKKFPAFYGTRKFITILTSPRHLSLSWANSILFPPPLPTSWRSILILCTCPIQTPNAVTWHTK